MQQTFKIFIKLAVGVFLLFVFNEIVLAHDMTPVGRYLTVENKPQPGQIDLLSQIIQVRFPQDVQTVNDAMNYLLRLSGYSLISVEHQNDALKSTLAKPLPAIDRDFEPMSLKDALTTLAGQAFYLVNDPLNRTVDFQVKPPFLKSHHHKSQSLH